MVDVAQLVRASGCGPEGRGFKSHRSPQTKTMKHCSVFIISGPSGAGKGTLIRTMLPEIPNAHVSISATTRPIRPGEIDGVDYYFMSNPEFDARIAAGAFLEWCTVHQNRYGTLKSEIVNATTNHPVIIEIDTQGAEKLRPQIDAVTIFILPPSLDVLTERLEKRGTESASDLKIRLDRASDEISAASGYDYAITNNSVEEGSQRLTEIIRSHLFLPVQPTVQ